ncbi:MAG: helix-hairpin-helix domain-containing protein [Candidatus Paceibacterota bacterium]
MEKFPNPENFKEDKSESKKDQELIKDEKIEGEKTQDDISDEEYDKFVKENFISNDRVEVMAEKIKKREEFSDRERAMYQERITEINEILREYHSEQILKIPGIGPKALETLREAGIYTIEDIKEKAEDGTLKDIEGFSDKKIDSILKNIKEIEEIEEKKKWHNRQEIRDFLIRYKEKQQELIALEKGLGKNPNEEKLEEYRRVLEDYKIIKAEYIGDKTWRALNEKKQRAELEAEKFLEDSKFEGVRKAWRWLGDQNIEKLIGERKSKTGKFLARFASLRTLTGLGLLGGGVAVGFGSAAGIALLSAKRILGGASVAFGSYDLMSQFSEKKMINISEEEIESMSDYDIDERVAKIEATTKFYGKNLLRNKIYNNLRLEQQKRLGKKRDDLEMVSDNINESFKEQKEIEDKIVSRRKKISYGVGALSILAFSSSSISNWLEDSSVSEIDTAEVDSDFNDQQFEELIADSTRVESVVRDSLIQDGYSEDLVESVSEEMIGTVEKGGSLWQAAKDIVESEKITEEQFKEAWSSSSSMVETASGQEIHISEAGLSHAGDQVVYVPESDDVPAHFEVVGSNIGSNQEYAEYLTEKGVELPNWLEKAVDSYESTAQEMGQEVSNLEPENLIQRNYIKGETFTGLSTEAIEPTLVGINLEKIKGSVEFLYSEEDGVVTPTEIKRNLDISLDNVDLRDYVESRSLGPALNSNKDILKPFASDVEVYKILRKDGYEKEAEFMKNLITERVKEIENNIPKLSIDKEYLDDIFKGKNLN